MRRWAETLLVPKVVVANQTRVIEAVADPDGAWIPGVPLITVRPTDPVDVPAVAAVLTSPYASAWAWHRAGGTGMSAGAMRLGPRWLAELPWPAGDLGGAVSALAAGDVAGCGEAVSVRVRARCGRPARRQDGGVVARLAAGMRPRGSRAALHHRGRRRVRRGRCRTERG